MIAPADGKGDRIGLYAAADGAEPGSGAPSDVEQVTVWPLTLSHLQSVRICALPVTVTEPEVTKPKRSDGALLGDGGQFLIGQAEVKLVVQRRRGPGGAVADNACYGSVTMFESTDHEQTIDFDCSRDCDEEMQAQYVTNAVFEFSPAGGSGYSGKRNCIDVFNAPCCWSNGESASYVTCFEFDSSSKTLDLTDNSCEVKNTSCDPDGDTVVKDYDCFIVSEASPAPILNFIGHSEPVTGSICNEGYSEPHPNMGRPTTADSALTLTDESCA